MGGSSKSSSASTTNYTTTNTSGTAAASGDNNGTMISGVSGSNITVTDHGAVNKALNEMFKVTDEALDFGSDALGANEAVTKAAIASGQTSLTKSLDFADDITRQFGGVLDKALSFGKEAMKSAEGATDSALDVAKNLSLDSDAATARDTNKNMMYSVVAIAIAAGIVAMKSK